MGGTGGFDDSLGTASTGEGQLDDPTVVSLLEERPPRRTADRRTRWRHLVLAGLLLPAVVALLVGLVLAQSTIKVPNDTTLLLVIDVSGSMTADDVKPDRITAAQLAARELVMTLPREMRIGVVAFSSHVDVLAEPTHDHTPVLEAIDGLAAAGGTAMGDAVVTALGLVRPATPVVDPAAPPSTGVGGVVPPPAGRVPASILLLSDGFDTGSQVHPFTAAGQASELEVPIYAVALGTEEGRALIPDGLGGAHLQTVPPDPGTMSTVAALTDGRFYRARSAGRLAKVYDDIAARVTRRDERRKASYGPLGLGVGLLVLAAGLSLAWRKKLKVGHA